MKKTIIIICVAIILLGLLAFAYLHPEPTRPPVLYHVKLYQRGVLIGDYESIGKPWPTFAGYNFIDIHSGRTAELVTDAGSSHSESQLIITPE